MTTEKRKLHFDRARALAEVIRRKDPKMEHAFTPEVADEILKKQKEVH